jgi:hypothetical protein
MLEGVKQVRGQKSEVRGQRTEVGRQRPADGKKFDRYGSIAG